MHYEYVAIKLENNKVNKSELAAHRAIIDEKASVGLRYVGFIPTSFGPSGKMLSVDLVFEAQ